MKKPSKRKKGSNSFDKEQADVLAASDRGSFFEQEELIALDEEKQNRWEDETVSASRAKIEGKGKDESAEPDSQESLQKLPGRTIDRNPPEGFLSLVYAKAFSLSSASLKLFH